MRSRRRRFLGTAFPSQASELVAVVEAFGAGVLQDSDARSEATPAATTMAALSATAHHARAMKKPVPTMNPTIITATHVHMPTSFGVFGCVIMLILPMGSRGGVR